MLFVVLASSCHTISHNPASNDIVYMSHYRLREPSLPEFPERILADMDKTGLDNSPFLNRYESALLSEMLPESLKWFNFSGKKVGFVDVSHNMGFIVINYWKKGYFEKLKRLYSDERIYFDNGMLYILNERQKKESGGFDVAIVCGNNFVLSEENIVKRLKKYKVEEE